MVWLFAFYWLESRSDKRERSILLAISFSWLGDVFLMLENSHELFFIAGLGSFLIAHVFYVFNFYRKSTLSISQILIAFGLLAYGIIMLFLLFPALPNDLQIPVTVYVFVILLMALSSLTRKNSVPEISFRLVFLGALLFVVSDSLIAVSKFLLPIPFSGLMIMATYIPAQFLIVWGKMKESE